MTFSKTDCIQKKILLRAPRSRVFRALTNAREFGQWFGAQIEGDFVPGQLSRGKIPYKGEEYTWEVTVEQIVPETLFSFRWHPYALDKNVDYSREPTTLVSFELEEAEGGTMLTVTESGFDRVPLARRAQAFQMNERGWEHQIHAIDRYLSAVQ